MEFKSRAPSAAPTFHTSRFLEVGLGWKAGPSLGSTWEPKEVCLWADEAWVVVRGQGGADGEIHEGRIWVF